MDECFYEEIRRFWNFDTFVHESKPFCRIYFWLFGRAAYAVRQDTHSFNLSSESADSGVLTSHATTVPHRAGVSAPPPNFCPTFVSGLIWYRDMLPAHTGSQNEYFISIFVSTIVGVLHFLSRRED